MYFIVSDYRFVANVLHIYLLLLLFILLRATILYFIYSLTLRFLFDKFHQVNYSTAVVLINYV